MIDPVPANDPGGTRTHDLAVKSRVLYQLSYRVGLTGTRRHPKLNLAATAMRRNRTTRQSQLLDSIVAL